MKISRWFALFICLPVLLFTLSACQKEPEFETVQTLNTGRFAAAQDGDTVYFAARSGLYRWKEGRKAELLDDDFFYNLESRSMTVLDGKVYSIRWDTGMLVSFDPETRETVGLAEVYNNREWFAGSVLNAQVWQWDGKLCCLSSNSAPIIRDEDTDIDLSDYYQLEIQIRDTDGTLLDTIPMLSDWAELIFAYEEYLFYLAGGALQGTIRGVNLETGKDFLLGRQRPRGVIDGKLLVVDEDGDYDLMDAEGNRTPYDLTNAQWLGETGGRRYYSKEGSFFLSEDGRLEELIHFVRLVPFDVFMFDGTLYLQMNSDLEILSDRLKLADATGENAEAVAEANDTRLFEGDGDTLTLALTSDDTFYLLNREA